MCKYSCVCLCVCALSLFQCIVPDVLHSMVYFSLPVCTFPTNCLFFSSSLSLSTFVCVCPSRSSHEPVLVFPPVSLSLFLFRRHRHAHSEFHFLLFSHSYLGWKLRLNFQGNMKEHFEASNLSHLSVSYRDLIFQNLRAFKNTIISIYTNPRFVCASVTCWK